MPLVPELGRQKQVDLLNVQASLGDISESQVSQGYIDPVSKQNETKPPKPARAKININK